MAPLAPLASPMSGGASGEACKHENSNFFGTIGLTNDDPTWPGEA